MLNALTAGMRQGRGDLNLDATRFVSRSWIMRAAPGFPSRNRWVFLWSNHPAGEVRQQLSYGKLVVLIDKGV